MDIFLRLLTAAAVRSVYLLLFKLCTVLGVTATADDLSKASTWAAGAIAIALGGLLEYYFPKVKAWARLKFSAAPSLLMVAAITAAATLFPLGGCSLFSPPTGISQQDSMLAAANDLETAYTVGAAWAIKQHKDGKISDEKWNTVVVPLEKTVWEYLQAAKTAALSGDQVTYVQQNKLFNDALSRFTAAYLGVDVSQVVPPTTMPE
jgi:hypothetical protein